MLMAFRSDDSTDQRLSRRGLLRLGGLALGGLAVGALAACSTAPAATSTAAKPAAAGTPAIGGGFDWQRYKGQTITVLNVQNSRTELMTQYQPEFAELTGI